MPCVTASATICNRPTESRKGGFIPRRHCRLAAYVVEGFEAGQLVGLPLVLKRTGKQQHLQGVDTERGAYM